MKLQKSLMECAVHASMLLRICKEISKQLDTEHFFMDNEKECIRQVLQQKIEKARQSTAALKEILSSGKVESQKVQPILQPLKKHSKAIQTFERKYLLLRMKRRNRLSDLKEMYSILLINDQMK